MIFRFLSNVSQDEAKRLESEIEQQLARMPLEASQIKQTCLTLSRFDPSFIPSNNCELEDFCDYLREAKTEFYWIALGINPRKIGDKGLNIVDALSLYHDKYDILSSNGSQIQVRWNFKEIGLGVYDGEATRSENGSLKRWKIIREVHD